MAVAMSRYLMPFLDDEEFVTAMVLQAGEPGRVTLVSCGHPPPLLVLHEDGADLVPLTPGLPLGLGDTYKALTVPWAPGDRALLYTDGLSEARNTDGDFLEVPKLGDVVRTVPLSGALDEILKAVRQHVPGGHFTDDLAMVLLENDAESGCPTSSPA